MNPVILSIEYFPNTTIGRPLAGASIFVGKVDLDPEVVGNQKQISIQQEDGTIVPVSQPINTNAGGVPTYLGDPVTILVEGQYSLKVNDSLGSQIYYVPTNILPDSASTFLSYYDCNFETAFAAIGAVNETHLIVDCAPDDLTGNLIQTGNITVEWRAGYPLGGAYTYTCNGELVAGLYTLFESEVILSGRPKIAFAPVQWGGAVADGSTNDSPALQKINDLLFTGGGKIYFPKGTYSLQDINETAPNVTFYGDGDVSILHNDQTFSAGEISAGTLKAIFEDPATGEAANNVWEDLFFQGQNPDGTVPGIGIARDGVIRITSGEGHTIRNCSFRGFGYNIVRMDWATGATEISNLKFMNNDVRWCRTGIWSKHGVDGYIVTGNYFRGIGDFCAAADDLSAGETRGTIPKNVVMSNNTVRGAVKVNSTGAFFVAAGNGVVISDNSIEDIGNSGDTVTGTAITASSGGDAGYEGLKRAEGYVITGNTIKDVFGQGISLQGTAGAVVSNNICLDYTTNGISLASSSLGDPLRNIVEGNYFGSSQGGTQGNRGVRIIDANALDNVIMNNKIYDVTILAIDDNGTRTLKAGNQEITSTPPVYNDFTLNSLFSVKEQRFFALELTLSRVTGQLLATVETSTSAPNPAASFEETEWMSQLDDMTDGANDIETLKLGIAQDFTVAVGLVDDGNDNKILLNIIDEYTTNTHGWLASEIKLNDTGTVITSNVFVGATNVNGINKLRPTVTFHNAATGAAYDLTAIGDNTSIAINIYGFCPQ